MEIKNAIIESASINIERGLLTAWVHLRYDAGGQGFGGYALYLPKDFKHSKNQNNYAGHFIFRVMEMADVSKWEDLKGKTVRVKSEHSKVHEIGHIVKDKWFNPSKEFEN